jgi:uncharacterized repeat protein (TIGR01451 family)
MSIASWVSVGACVALCLAAGQGSAAARRPTTEEHDALGRVVRRAGGERVTHPPAVAPTPAAPAAGPRRVASQGTSVLPVVDEWRRNTYGTGIGQRGSLYIVDLEPDGDMDIVAPAAVYSFAPATFWYALSRSGSGYPQHWVSDSYPDDIDVLRVAQADADPAWEVVVGTPNALYVYDGATHELQRTISKPAAHVRGLAVSDVDADAVPEAVVCDADSASTLHVFSLATGAQEHIGPGYGCEDLAIGNVDGDPGLEIVIAASPGQVLDAATRVIEWTNPAGFGATVRLGDLDLDGRAEVVAAEWGDLITVWNVDLQAAAGSISTALEVTALKVVDVEGDGPLEIVYGDGQWGKVHVHNGQTLALKWQVDNIEHGVTDLAVGNVDGDPAPELLWGAGYTSTGPDHLYVYDTVAQVREWESLDVTGPFYGLSHGDVDADGQPELLYSSWESDSGYGAGLWFVHDAQSKAVEFESGEPTDTNSGWSRIANANVDADPQQEVFVTSMSANNGVIICYDGLTHDEQWRTRTFTWAYVSLQVGEVDGTPGLELVAGTSGPGGPMLVVFDAESGTDEWQVPLSSSGWGYPSFLRLGSIDGDPAVEIIAGIEEGAVHVVDGATHVVDDLGLHEVSALELIDRNGDGVAEILVGTERGEIRLLTASGSVLQTLGPYAGRIDGLQVRDVTGDGALDFVFCVRNEMLIRDGATGTTYWTSGWLGFAGDVGARDSLLLADLDQDGLQEIFVNLGRIGVRVFEIPRTNDLSLAVIDAQDPVLLGNTVTYSWHVDNPADTPANDVTLAVALPTGATFVSSTPGPPICTAASGALTCALGTVGAQAGAAVAVVVMPQVPAVLSSAGQVTAAVIDPDLADNQATETTHVTAQIEADLAVAKDDGVVAVAAGQVLTYQIAVTNNGPWPVTSVVLVDTLPPGLLNPVFTPFVGSYDPGTGIWSGLDLQWGASATLALAVTVAPGATGTLVNRATVSPSAGVVDLVPGNDTGVDADVASVGRELIHGSMVVSPVDDGGMRYFRMRQQPTSSYEIVVDGASGDLGDAAQPLNLQRVAADLSTVLAEAGGGGFARSLRWETSATTVVDDQAIRVRSTACTASCGADDLFRIRAYDTTGDIARFNNTGGQVTVVLLQNLSSATVAATVRFWSPTGALLHAAHFGFLPPRGLATLNTVAQAPLSGLAGSITVTSNAPYGLLVGKAVSVEPATGFAFDTPLRPRPH